MKVNGEANGLRAQRMAQTRQDIVEALLRLLEKEHPAQVSMPRVAEESGVSLRTLYRYFPSKAELIDETSKWMNKLASPGTSDYGDIAVHNLKDLLTRQWNGFDQHLGGIRAQHMSAAGREIRQHRLDKTRSAGVRALERTGLTPSAEDRDRLVDASIAISSSSTYLELVDRMGHDSTDAAELATWITEAILEHYRRTGTTRPTSTPTNPPATADSTRRDRTP